MEAAYDPVISGLLFAGGALIVALLVALGYEAISFHRTAYAKRTGNSALATMRDADRRGEYRLGLQLERFDPRGRMLFDVYVPRPDGSTSEIDAVLVARSGVYVFENKNYSGRIFGEALQRIWTRSPNDRSRLRFPNPILQNEEHVEALEEFLDLGDAVFVPIVVFADRAVLRKVDVGTATVMRTSAVAARLRDIDAGRRLRLRDEEVDAIFEALAACANAPSAAKRAHIARLHALRTCEKGCDPVSDTKVHPERESACR